MLRLLCYKAADFHYYFGGFLHRADGHEFVAAVEVEPTGKNVGAGQTLERELGAVGAASDGLTFGVTPTFSIALMAVSMMCITGSIFSRML